MPLLRNVAFVLIVAASPALATIVGHESIDGVGSLPQTVMDAVGQQTWLFAHASVGANIVGGMTTLRGGDPVRYRLTFAAAGDGGQILSPPALTVPGTVYEGNRGNPGWSQKFTMFDGAVRLLGWSAPVVQVVMDKLCYIDQDASAAAYLASMSALESDYPGTILVYTTMPLQSGVGANWANILATNYNRAVRTHCAGGGRLLYDLADIECHDPDGNPVTFTDSGVTYERLYSGYTSDGGHLNATGARRAALGWYAVAAAIAQRTTAAPLPPEAAAARITSVAPNPFNPATTIRFRMARPGPVQLALYDTRGRLVGRLVEGELPAGEQAVTWRGLDAAGRAAPSGLYLARLSVEGVTSVRRLALVR